MMLNTLLGISLWCAATGSKAEAVEEYHETIVIGAGPAGVQLAYSLDRLGWDFVVLERSDHPGSFFDKYPRHRRLISQNRRNSPDTHPDALYRHDWNSLIGDTGARRVINYTTELYPDREVITRYLAGFIEDHSLGPRFRFGVDVSKVNRPKGSRYILSSGDVVYTCDILIVATGRWVPNQPFDFPGSEYLTQCDDVDVTGKAYSGHNVMMLGAGNSALEVADALEPYAAAVHLITRDAPRFAYQSHYPGDISSRNARFQDRYLLKSEEVLINDFTFSEADPTGAEVRVVAEGKFIDTKAWFELRKRNDSEGMDLMTQSWKVDKFENGSVNMGTLRLEADDISPLRRHYDTAIVCVGWLYNASIFAPHITPEEAHKGMLPRLTSTFESTTAANMYFAGAIGHALDWKVSGGGSIHGFRHLARVLPHIIAMRTKGQQWPSEALECSVAALQAAIHHRLATSSSLFQMFSMMGDVFFATGGMDSGCKLEHMKDVPLPLISSPLVEFGPRNAVYLEVTLEWNPDFTGHGVLAGERTQGVLNDEKIFESVASADRDFVESVFLKGRGKRNDLGTAIPRGGNILRSDGDSRIHPVLRLYKRNPRKDNWREPELLDIFQLPSDSWARWDDEVTMKPLLLKWLNDIKHNMFPGGESCTSK
eukprot:Hpha_TRINITY_DN14149_c0_g1::TRINITY_DN14149_c0_g1_i3::g.11204::m.11204